MILSITTAKLVSKSNFDMESLGKKPRKAKAKLGREVKLLQTELHEFAVRGQIDKSTIVP